MTFFAFLNANPFWRATECSLTRWHDVTRKKYTSSNVIFVFLLVFKLTSGLYVISKNRTKNENETVESFKSFQSKLLGIPLEVWNNTILNEMNEIWNAYLIPLHTFEGYNHQQQMSSGVNQQF